MASEILTKFGTAIEPTITLTSIANGAGRISAVMDLSSIRPLAIDVYVKFKTGGSAPTANTPVKFYWIPQSNAGTNVIGGGGALGDSDAAVSAEPLNAEQIGAVVVTTATNTSYSERLPRFEAPSAKGSIVVWNAIGQTLNGTPDSPAIQVIPITAEGQ